MGWFSASLTGIDPSYLQSTEIGAMGHRVRRNISLYYELHGSHFLTVLFYQLKGNV